MAREPELLLDAGTVLGVVGDRRKVSGTAAARLGEGFQMDFMPGDDISWSLELRRIAGGVEIDGRISGEVALECFRCIEQFPFPLDLHLREHALWLESEHLEPGDDFSDEYTVMDGLLDLEPIIRDALVLAIPSKRLCAEQCAGLCPTCGANLNVEECECPEPEVDERLLPLAALKQRLEERRGEG